MTVNVVGRAIDFANFTHVPSTADLNCLRQQGFDLAIVGASFDNSVWGPNQPQRQLRALQANGFRRHAYCWLRHPFTENHRLFDNAFVQIAGTGVEMMWIDVEDVETAQTTTVAQRIKDVWLAIDYWRNARPDLPIGIYTADWWWDAYMPGVKETFRMPLWMAAYVFDEEDLVGKTGITEPIINQYIPGGWKPEDLWLWQYMGTINTCGLNTDRNIILEAGRMKYTDDVLDRTFGALLTDLGSKGATIHALGLGLAQVAQDLYTHIFNNGDFTQPQLAQLDSLRALIDSCNRQVADLEDALRAAGIAFNGR